MPASYKIDADLSKFKSEIKSGQAAMKALAAEMRLAQAQFAATGNSEQLAANKASILSRQVETLSAQAQSASAAMMELSKSGQENSIDFQKMKQVQAEAEAQMLELQNASQETTESLEKSAKSALNMQSVLKGVGSAIGFGSVSAGINTVFRIFEKIAAKAKETEESIRNAGKWANDLVNSAAISGFTPEESQRFDYAASQLGIDSDTLIKARDKIQAELVDAFSKRVDYQSKLATANGKEKADLEREIGALDYMFLTDGINQYSVGLKDNNGQLRDSIDIMWSYIDTINKLQDATAREKYAQELFGKSYSEVSKLIEGGKTAFDALQKVAPIVSDEDVEKLGTMVDYEERLAEAQKTLERQKAAGKSDKMSWEARYEYNRIAEQIGADIDVEAYIKKRAEFFGTQFDTVLLTLARKFGADNEYLIKYYGEDLAKQAGESISKYTASGVNDSLQAAYDAGLALGQAAAAGVAAAAAGGGGGQVTNNNNNQYFGDTYNYNFSAGASAAELNRQAASYGE